MDSHLYPDYLVPPNYDSLLGKLIVWGEDRDQVRAGLRHTNFDHTCATLLMYHICRIVSGPVTQWLVDAAGKLLPQLAPAQPHSSLQVASGEQPRKAVLTLSDPLMPLLTGDHPCCVPWMRLSSPVSLPLVPSTSCQRNHPTTRPCYLCFQQAITRMLRALDETVITGVPTTGPFHKLLLNHHAFKAGDVDTGFIPKYIDELKTPPPTSKVRHWGCCCCWDWRWGS